MSLKAIAAALISASCIATNAQAVSIVEVAAEDERLTSFLEAVEAADLIETLSGDGQFTIYAPVNDAFDNIAEGAMGALLLPENRDRLTEVLLYHIDDRILLSMTFPHGPNHYRPMLSSERLCITSGASGLTIADGSGEIATVIVADITADNGVIHLIDKVLLPGERPPCH